MSKEGLPTPKNVSGEGLRVAVVTATWNAEICDQLHRRALETAEAAGAVVTPLRVVGALELPVVVQAAARTHDAVVALGCVVRGGTPHFDYVCDSVTQGLTRIALDESTPVANGVLTVNDYDQAVDRAGFADSAEDKGAEAMQAALETVHTLRTLDESNLK
ncbi:MULTISPECIES: 6,7-dimethyl-8-ribityllumazine synthase [Corynebacterium]|uniref:6,7-dimethyl-8-ribityllumazine synthase n=1 Tax=Corynebacterium aurimucosum TaxID=169292 RepID=A0A558GKY7_9CORY|nr:MULTISPECIES: 6,7-dimethyl-8-ribityllumazine synthase [Corynebacterium]MBU5655209.1 6,7-dimethyl-8-ribityllumazine synthase [Corynebacterium aurimucosum]MDK6813951.1 6,7-dimethyl-8-ribityllumazine synthase [Corynebacterium sp. UMB6689]OFL23202.1 6,7-dimethyl-8-ribityllumazine synthase [Corynebacterium sp. HMSC062A03]OFP21329.1 6,7-dimethyl-8-ribityllumazine synthase [Corynebacterium sp. HMSC066C02]OFQ34593.1 6,7-dimethyl-8-ribityllumazine synthase [Corynebacterium sp. HMSC072D12]